MKQGKPLLISSSWSPSFDETLLVCILSYYDCRFESMAGTALVPPIGSERLEELGPMVPFNISVEGDDWKRSCQDIAIAGELASHYLLHSQTWRLLKRMLIQHSVFTVSHGQWSHSIVFKLQWQHNNCGTIFEESSVPFTENSHT